jgi:hypothetical protein
MTDYNFELRVSVEETRRRYAPCEIELYKEHVKEHVEIAN